MLRAGCDGGFFLFLGSADCFFEEAGEAGAVEDVVAQHKAGGVVKCYTSTWLSNRVTSVVLSSSKVHLLSVESVRSVVFFFVGLGEC